MCVDLPFWISNSSLKSKRQFKSYYVIYSEYMHYSSPSPAPTRNYLVSSPRFKSLSPSLSPLKSPSPCAWILYKNIRRKFCGKEKTELGVKLTHRDGCLHEHGENIKKDSLLLCQHLRLCHFQPLILPT